MNLSPERLMNMFVNLFIRRIMMQGINFIIGRGMKVGRRALKGRRRGEVAEDQARPQLNDFSNRD